MKTGAPWRHGRAQLGLWALWVGSLGMLAQLQAESLVFPSIPSTPPIAPYQLVEAFPGLPDVRAVVLTSPPGETNHLFLADQRGLVQVITNLHSPTLTTVLDLRQSDYIEIVELGLQGLTFHPDFAKNGLFYTFRTVVMNGYQGYGTYNWLSQFTWDRSREGSSPTDTEVTLIEQYDREPGHNGGDLHFGPDGLLYVSLGDEGLAPGDNPNVQNLGGDFFSGILRLDVGPRFRFSSRPPNPHPAIRPGTYRVPLDNPFWQTTEVRLSGDYTNRWNPDQTRSEFWAFGMRNPWRFSFDPLTGDLYANDVGESAREEINQIVRGGNYGWVFWEGSLPISFAKFEDLSRINPVFEYGHDRYRMAITANYVYRGSRYPELDGKVLFSDFGGPLGAWTPGTPLQVDGKLSEPAWLGSRAGIATIGLNPATGELLFSDVYRGRILKLVRTDSAAAETKESGTKNPEVSAARIALPAAVAATTAPRLLSQTGLFADLKNLTPSPGLEPYAVNVPLWSDYAQKSRWVARPDRTARFGFRRDDAWETPTGTVFVKHFDLELRRGDPTSSRRIETRVLRRTETGIWGATYRWNETGTDAELVTGEGADLDLTIEENGNQRIQRWRYPSTFECLACHNAQAGWVLGFHTAQLNRDSEVAGRGNQLQWLAREGWLKVTDLSPNLLPALSQPDDERTSLTHRFRSQLVANCMMCHRDKGDTWQRWDARPHVPLAETALLDTRIDSLGFVQWPVGLDESEDHPARLISRVERAEGVQPMPPLGTTEPNATLVALAREWVDTIATSRESYEAWRNRHWPDDPALDPRAAPTADPDRDGLTNEAEWLLGEDPLDRPAKWRFRIENSGNRGPQLQFERKAEVGFQVESSETLAPGSWKPLDHPENRPWFSAHDETTTIPLPGSAVARFYRVRIYSQ